jgi:nucleotide-binding universal stress UspA family protein
MFEKIIVATDGSDHAREAIGSPAISPRNTIPSLHIVHTPQAVGDTLIVGYTAVPVPPTKEEMEKAGREVIGAAESEVREAALRISPARWSPAIRPTPSSRKPRATRPT